MAVDPLLQVADRKGEELVFESRVWAIVTLCNSGSERARRYIIKSLRELATAIVTDMPLPRYYA